MLFSYLVVTKVKMCCAVRLCQRYMKSRRKSLKKFIIGVIISGMYSLRYAKGSNGNKNGAKTTHIFFYTTFLPFGAAD